jgi:hypothetical protein
MIPKPAEFTHMCNDLFWSFYTPEFEKLTWTGYDDSFWWTNIAPDENWRIQKDKNGNLYRLDIETNLVTQIKTNDLTR